MSKADKLNELIDFTQPNAESMLKTVGTFIERYSSPDVEDGEINEGVRLFDVLSHTVLNWMAMGEILELNSFICGTHKIFSKNWDDYDVFDELPPAVRLIAKTNILCKVIGVYLTSNTVARKIAVLVSHPKWRRALLSVYQAEEDGVPWDTKLIELVDDGFFESKNEMYGVVNRLRDFAYLEVWHNGDENIGHRLLVHRLSWGGRGIAKYFIDNGIMS